MNDATEHGSHEAHQGLVTPYCFGDLDPDQQQQFELHLLTCDECFRDVERLMSNVETLRAHASAGALTPSDVVSLLGISGQLQEPFGGQFRYLLLTAATCGFLYAESVLTELSYFIDRYSAVAVWIVPISFVWMAGSVFSALALAIRLERSEARTAVWWTSGLLASCAAMYLVFGYAVLPHEPSIAAQFQPRTVAGANLRNTLLYGLPLTILFVMIPFHFVLAAQRELTHGRAENLLKLLLRDPLGLRPRGVLYVPPLVLGVVLAAATVYLIVANQYLLDNLVSGPHSELFTVFIYSRIVGGLGLAVGCLAWYVRHLDELKREAIALTHLRPSPKHSRGADDALPPPLH